MGNSHSHTLGTLYPALAEPGRFPVASCSTVELQQSGRRLGYSVYVFKDALASSTAASGGISTPQAVILLPGSPGCRLFSHPSLQPLASSSALHIIVLERPGIGLSDRDHGPRSLLAFGADFREFCELLNLKSVALLGYSAGTPWALAVARSCPDLVHSLALVSCIAPPACPNKTAGMAWLFRAAYFAAPRFPALLRWVVASDAAAARRDPVGQLRKSFAPYSAELDKTTLARPKVEGMFLESLLEGLARRQEMTECEETLLWTRDWGFGLGEVGVRRVKVWQGEQDRGCTPAMARYVCGEVPGCEAVFVPGAGHLLYFDVFQDVVQWLIDPS